MPQLHKTSVTYACLLIASLCAFYHTAYANWQPYCAITNKPRQKIIAYLGADAQWSIEKEDLAKLQNQLHRIDVLNYAFIRLNTDALGNTIPKLSIQDINNLRALRQLRSDLPIIIAIGGWGDREGFRDWVTDARKRRTFILATKQLLIEHQLDGIDIDWENELLANQEEINSIASLMREMKQEIRPEGYCVTNAVPATPWYWRKYPNTQWWKDAIDWTTVMAYDHYGTFGHKTEHGAALFDTKRPDDKHYPYPQTSGDLAIKHYFQQGLAAEKIILGVPFYCHSYFIEKKSINKKSKTPGLHVPVIDANINSQVSYIEAWERYGEQLFSYHDTSSTLSTPYGLIPLDNTSYYRFMSCDSPKSMANKIDYAKGANFLRRNQGVTLGGVSFWSLQQDLPIEHPYSLLKEIYQGLKERPN